MVSIAFFPQALALILLVNTMFWKTIIVMAISQSLFVWGVHFITKDLYIENIRLKKMLDYERGKNNGER